LNSSSDSVSVSIGTLAANGRRALCWREFAITGFGSLG